MTPGQNSTLNCDPNPRSHFDFASQFNVESRPGVTIQRGIMTRDHNSTWNLYPGHNSTWNHDPGSQFNVELWPGVIIQCGIMTPGQNFTLNYDPGHSSTLNCDPNPWSNWTLNHDSGSQFNVELRPGFIIQRGIKTRVTIQPGVKILSVGGVVIQWPPVSGVAIQHEKPVESWAQSVE